MIAGLPHSVSVQLAAVLAGVSRQTFAERFVHSGLVPLRDRRVPLADLERAIGRQITVETYLAADRSLDAYRQKQRQRQEAFAATADAARAARDLARSAGPSPALEDAADYLEYTAKIAADDLLAGDEGPTLPQEPAPRPAIKPPTVAEPQVAEPAAPVATPITLTLRAVQQLVEVAYLSRLLAQTGGSMVKAAAIAGMDRCHLHRLAQGHGLKARDYRHPNSAGDLVSRSPNTRCAPVSLGRAHRVPLQPVR